jgi:hypothetical protein
MDLDFQSSPKLTEVLDATVEWILEDYSWNRQFYGRQIIEPMLSNFGSEAKSLIRRLIYSQDEQMVRLANLLLDAAPHNFVIRDPEFVAELTEKAHQMPKSLSRLVVSGLHGSAEYAMRSRSVGVDDPEEIALRDETTAIAQRYPVGSPPRRFYEEAANRASGRLVAERMDTAA